jgi:hypothetical protein
VPRLAVCGKSLSPSSASGEPSLFGGSATRFTDWTLRRPVSAPVTHHDLNGVISWLIADAETPAFRGRLFGSLVGVAEAA